MRSEQEERVALFDMDGTLVDYIGQLSKDLGKLGAPGEPEITDDLDDLPYHMQNRADVIRSSADWWRTLPRLELGWDILNAARELDYRIMILTQGPRRNAAAWTGKKLWIDENLGPDVDVTITRDKGLVYGKVLVDDFPKYVERWLKWRKNGLVIMPAREINRNFTHPQVVKYDGTNMDEVRDALRERLKSAFRKDSRVKVK
ncbi:MAG: hypothetical protein KGH65_01935 [Candidatus Micrarchaeota archaeon]|nr:hypothetical protein [Candidatus Micrarchaeota archaeon]